MKIKQLLLTKGSTQARLGPAPTSSPPTSLGERGAWGAVCRSTRCILGIFPLAFAALLPLATPLRAAIPPVENLLPADTLFLLNTPDCAALRAASHQSPQWLFWNDPAMKAFHDKFVAKWNEEFVAPLEHDLGVKLDDFATLLQGQFAVALTQNGWNGSNDVDPGLLLLLDSGNKSGLLKTNLAGLRQKWVQAGQNHPAGDPDGNS